MIELTLPYPVSVNAYKKVGSLRRTGSGKIYQTRVNTEETKRYYYLVWMKIRSLMAAQPNLKPFPATIPIEVSIDLYPRDKRLMDIDNCVKVVLDSLQRGGLIENDRSVARLLVTRKDIIDQGQLIVRIQEI